MGDKTLPKLLVLVVISLVVFGVVHDLDLNPHGSVAGEMTVDHTEAIPHFDEICALTLIGAGLVALGLSRALDRGPLVVFTPRCRKRFSLAADRDTALRSPGFQLLFPMLA